MNRKPTGTTLLRWAAELALALIVVLIAIQLMDSYPGTDDRSGGIGPSDGAARTVSLAELGLVEDSRPLRDRPGWEPPRKVVVMDMWPGRTAGIGDAAPGLEVVVAATEAAAAAAVVDADALLGALTPTLFEAGTRLRWIQLPAAGVERFLAIPGLADRDLVLTNAQRIFAPGGAEHVLALALALTRRIPLSLELQRDRSWDAHAVTGPTPYTGSGSELRELRGRTMLIAGLGGIGTETARLAHGIGMRVTATRNSSRDGPEFVDYVGLADEFETLAAEADVVVNTLPLTADTEGMFDAAMFASLKPGALFINIGRGRTVDTDALVAALREGRLAGAGLDVTDPEPLPAGHPLWGMSNVIITPHVGGDSDGHMERMYLLFEENLRRFAAGDPLLSVVDPARGY
ncbi:MAG: D-2-hydroxyacid dehydrogenase [Gemmatimonadota bacterium]|nr:D-2-hydroxyacid dehydrogenase [Gemmatimonadota bacterium]